MKAVSGIRTSWKQVDLFLAMKISHRILIQQHLKIQLSILWFDLYPELQVGTQPELSSLMHRMRLNWHRKEVRMGWNCLTSRKEMSMKFCRKDETTMKVELNFPFRPAYRNTDWSKTVRRMNVLSTRRKLGWRTETSYSYIWSYYLLLLPKLVNGNWTLFLLLGI